MKGIDSKIFFALGIAVLALVILGIVTSIGASLMAGIQTTQATTALAVNDSETFTVNDTAGAQSWDFNTAIAGSVTFAGNKTFSLAGNYSYNSTHAWLLINTPLPGAPGVGTYNFSYTYTTYTTPYLISGNTTLGLSNVGQQLPIIGTILVFGAVIAFLLMLFWFRKSSL